MVRIFLASSAELDEDKRKFGAFINDKNKEWRDDRVFIELTTWRDFISDITGERTQDRYNEYIQKCDIVVMLFHTRVGRYTEEEFDVAYSAFKNSNGKKPRIFAFFKDEEQPSQDIVNFQKKIDDLDQFYAHYSSDDNLYHEFNRQLERLASKGFIKKNRIDGNKLFKRLLLVLLPLLIVVLTGLAIYWLSPFTLTVGTTEIQSHSLPFRGADIVLSYADKKEELHIDNVNDEVIFKEIHSKYRNTTANLQITSPGYRLIDTTFALSKKILVPLRRNNSLGVVMGEIMDDRGNPIKDVLITIDDLTATTNSSGQFKIEIPIEKQSSTKRVVAIKKGYQRWDREGVPSDKIAWRIVMKK